MKSLAAGNQETPSTFKNRIDRKVWELCGEVCTKLIKNDFQIQHDLLPSGTMLQKSCVHMQARIVDLGSDCVLLS